MVACLLCSCDQCKGKQKRPRLGDTAEEASWAPASMQCNNASWPSCSSQLIRHLNDREALVPWQIQETGMWALPICVQCKLSMWVAHCLIQICLAWCTSNWAWHRADKPGGDCTIPDAAQFLTSCWHFWGMWRNLWRLMFSMLPYPCLRGLIDWTLHPHLMGGRVIISRFMSHYWVWIQTSTQY